MCSWISRMMAASSRMGDGSDMAIRQGWRNSCTIAGNGGIAMLKANY